MAKKKADRSQRYEEKQTDEAVYEIIAELLMKADRPSCRAITAETVARIRILPLSGPQLPCADEIRELLRNYGLLPPVEPERSAAGALKNVLNNL